MRIPSQRTVGTSPHFTTGLAIASTCYRWARKRLYRMKGTYKNTVCTGVVCTGVMAVTLNQGPGKGVSRSQARKHELLSFVYQYDYFRTTVTYLEPVVKVVGLPFTYRQCYSLHEIQHSSGPRLHKQSKIRLNKQQ